MHTGRNVYLGNLVSVSTVLVVLDADSDVLDGPVLIRIDASRIEAVEVAHR